MQYYTDKQYIAKVDTNDKILGKIERWEAHKKGILHRGITIMVYFEDCILLQKRKHPIFDGVLDATISTHQLYSNSQLAEDIDTTYRALERELNISLQDLTKPPELNGSILYKAVDPKSEYVEHEICHILTCSVSKLPKWNPDFAYEVSIHKKQEFTDQNSLLFKKLALWVQVMVEKKLL